MLGEQRNINNQNICKKSNFHQKLSYKVLPPSDMDICV